jgi:hypothetical protein
MVSNINDRSFLLEPDVEVCLPGTVERWRVTPGGGRTVTRLSRVVTLEGNGRNLRDYVCLSIVRKLIVWVLLPKGCGVWSTNDPTPLISPGHFA